MWDQFATQIIPLDRVTSLLMDINNKTFLLGISKVVAQQGQGQGLAFLPDLTPPLLGKGTSKPPWVSILMVKS